MLNLSPYKQDVEGLILVIAYEAQTAEGARLVELSHFLWSMINSATRALETIKENRLRAHAVQHSQGVPGPITISGPANLECVVTIPEPDYRLKKGCDIRLLRTALGERFEDFFTEEILVQPRREAGDLVAQITDPPLRQIMLDALVEFPGTPRVAFRVAGQNET